MIDLSMDRLKMSPLFISFIFYIIISLILVSFKPDLIFGFDPTIETELEQRNRVIICFVLLAIFIYAISCSYISQNIRNDICNNLMDKNIKTLLKNYKCK
jgi:uncharacterized membrane protein YjgN (DUF898 family)